MLLFRDGRGSGASANDGLWVLTMFAAMPAAWAVGTDWAVVAAWGLGALAGAVLGVAQLRAGPARPKTAWDWVVADAWPLGRWFAAESVVYTVASQLALFGLAAIVGAAAVGGLRSVQVLFAPLTLLGPALALPGLPAVRIALLDSSRAAMRVAMRLSGILVLLTSVYLLVSVLNGGALLTAVFGTEFSLYRSLIWPVGTQQLISAGAAGPYMLLKASGRAKSILVTRLVSSIGMLVALALLAPRFGITGGAWALTLGTLIGGLLTATLVYVGRR